MNDLKSLKLEVGSINVNSFNVSTLGTRNSKTALKIEGVTSKKQDVLLICDCRIGNNEREISKMLGLNRNCSYKAYYNSNMDHRGVLIAIKRNIVHEVLDRFVTIDQNVLLLKVKIKGVCVVLGSIYGPNEQKPEFFRNIRSKLEEWGLPFIIGGDFNTVLDRTLGDGNLDREGGGRLPNVRNSEEINNWIEQGDCMEPFRALYPEQKETSYIPFRGGRVGAITYSRSRLDFFLVNRNLIGEVKKVRYEDRLGNDFDHKMVTLILGKGGGVKGQLRIFNSTLEHRLGKFLGEAYIYDALSNHLSVREEETTNRIGLVLRLIEEYMDVERLGYMQNNVEGMQYRLQELYGRIEDEVILLPGMDDMLNKNYSCDWGNLYEVVTSSLKIKLLALQKLIKEIKGCKRNFLVTKIERMKGNFGVDSEQAADCIRDLNDFDDQELKERARKYKEFLLVNNEKPTRAFCLLGKETNLLDDMSQIKDKDGNCFADRKAREEYIRKYYQGLYNKKIDNILRIEDFLGDEGMNNDWVGNKKLTEEEKNSLETAVTLEEIKKALETSNLSSTSGWDGISYMVIKKYFTELGPLLVKVTNECMERGELTATFKLGLIKLIPKKGDANKIEDWRPISLLCCGYKLISGVVALRLEKFLDKIIGRAQKGFQRTKNMNSCNLNIMDRIAGAWEHSEEMGVLCIDFVKAFDSVEHEFIRNVLGFFNYGEVFIKMVMTLLNGRVARVLVDDGMSEIFHIDRGTPQGDRASPYIFIMCIEILLIKIKSKEGRGINNCDFIREWLSGNGMRGEGTAEGFADDLTLLFKFLGGTMEGIVAMMDEFKGVSGLELNKNKTQLMIVGSDRVPLGTKIIDIEVVDHVKILGIKIDRKLSNLDTNWDVAVGKIERLIRFWKLQRLSISGRILVAKTYLMSQATFLMGSLELSKQMGDRINGLLANYVKGNDRIIAKERWGIARELGGYGLIDTHTLNTCIKSAWINKWIINVESLDINGKRGGVAMGKPVDQWGEGSFGGVDTGTRIIMREWKNYKRRFYNVGGNVGRARVMENDGLIEGVKNVGIRVFGEERYNRLGLRAKLVRIEELVENGRVKDKVLIEGAMGQGINMAEYFRLRNIVGDILRIFGGNTVGGKCLDEFMRGRKRGGGHSGERYMEREASSTWKGTLGKCHLLSHCGGRGWRVLEGI